MRFPINEKNLSFQILPAVLQAVWHARLVGDRVGVEIGEHLVGVMSRYQAKGDRGMGVRRNSIRSIERSVREGEVKDT
jgi:hypothetical protein